MESTKLGLCLIWLTNAPHISSIVKIECGPLNLAVTIAITGLNHFKTLEHNLVMRFQK